MVHLVARLKQAREHHRVAGPTLRTPDREIDNLAHREPTLLHVAAEPSTSLQGVRASAGARKWWPFRSAEGGSSEHCRRAVPST